MSHLSDWTKQMSERQIRRQQQAEEKQRVANDTGYPHHLNGMCQAYRPHSYDDGRMFTRRCRKPLYASADRRTGTVNVHCGLLSCPDYDIPKDPAPDVTVRFPKGSAPFEVMS